MSHFICLVSVYKDFFKPSIVPREDSHTCLRAGMYSGRDTPLILLAFLKCLQPLSSPTEQTPHRTRGSAAGLVFLLLS